MGDLQEVLAEPVEPGGSCWEGREEMKESVIGSWKEGDPCYFMVEGSGALLPASETPLMNAKENFRKNIRSAAQFLLMAYSKK